MSGEAILLDTNILVHAYNTHEKKRHAKCKAIVDSAFSGRARFAVSNQILAELFSVITKKLENPFSMEEAETIVSGIADSANWIKINYTHETVKRAVVLSRENRISIWDSLIASTALDNGIAKIYTENTKDFKNIAKLSAVDPVEAAAKNRKAKSKNE